MNKQNYKELLMLFVGLGLVMLFLEITDIGCFIKWVTGVSCPGCGMTRACREALQLHFLEASYYHPLFWLMPVVLVLFLIKNKLSEKALIGISGTILAAFFVVYVIRLMNQDDGIVTINLNKGIIGRIVNYIRAVK